MRLYMTSLVALGRGPEKTTVSDIVLSVSTHRLHIHFSDLRLAELGVITADVNNNLMIFTFVFSQQF